MDSAKHRREEEEEVLMCEMAGNRCTIKVPEEEIT